MMMMMMMCVYVLHIYMYSYFILSSEFSKADSESGLVVMSEELEKVYTSFINNQVCHYPHCVTCEMASMACIAHVF